uniref:Aminotransferase (ACSL, fadD) n=1 Tax=uncultured marine thaumarchaeote KM3_53_H02 TaxID=1456187 RepID=A0A075HBR4_9ARCH|nr:aminotransferase (ACSL, fadD) [uncultured marine thaumarchaeote KM3_53_H02]
MNSIEILKKIPQKNRDRIFLFDELEKKQLSFNDLDISAKSIANYLIKSGLKKGDKVSVILENSSVCVKIYFGCLYAGMVIVPTNPSLNKQEIQHIILHSLSKCVIINHDTNQKIDNKKMNKNGILILDFNESKDSQINLKCNEDNLEISQDFIPFDDMVEDDDLCIVYSAGTTGDPKALVHSIKDLVMNAQEFGKLFAIDNKSIFCNMLSLTYLGGFYNLLILPYVLNSSVVLTQAFDPKLSLNFWEAIIRNNVNTLWLVPSIMSILLEMDRSVDGKKYCKKNIKLALVGTAPLPIQLRRDFEKQYHIKICENYGLSETLFISSETQQHNKYGSVGKLLPGVEIKIVDRNGTLLPTDQEGEILVKTPYLIREYHDITEESRQKFSNKIWFATGDLGKLDHDGFLYITGRKKDLIIRGGINISPASIENAIHTHENVLECAVVGIQHKIQGEEIIAVVRLDKTRNFSAIKEELIEICKNDLSAIELPSRIIMLSEFPHATYGKIQKNKIKSWLIKNPNSALTKIIPNETITELGDFLPSDIAAQSNEALSIKYNTEVYEKQRRGEDVIVLSLGEAFFDLPLFSFDNLPYPKIYHYSHSRGIPELRQKLSKYFFETYDVSYDYEKEILITAGSKIAIYMCLMAILNPKDEVLVYEPAWVSFTEQIRLAYGIPVHIPYDETIYNFEKYITDKTKMIIINNPNNPTGKVYSLEELSYLYQLAKKYKLYVLSDEAYSDFVIDQNEFISFANLDTEKKHTIVINSISKNFGISGWRLGYVITNPNLISELLKINQHLITCPPTILEYYVDKHFDEIISITKPQIKDLTLKRKQIMDYMNSLSLEFLPGTTTFYFFVSISKSKLNSEEFCWKLLQEHHISTVPGIGYGKSCDKFIRVSIGSESIERVKKGLKIITNLISSTSN